MTTATCIRERRVTNTHELIANICRNFSEATGWSMTFLAADDGQDDSIWSSFPDDSDSCWRADLHDGNRLIGVLSISLPDATEHDRSFLSIRYVADIIAQLLNQLCSTLRILESRTNELTTLVDLGLSVPCEADLLDAIRQLLCAAVQLTGFRSAAFFLLDPSTKELNLRVIQDLEIHCLPEPRRDLRRNPPDLRALMSRTVILQKDQGNEEESWLPDGNSVGVCVAVENESGPIGTLWAFDRRLRTPTPNEIHVLRSLATQIALILERIVLLKESASEHRLQRELRIVSESQPHPLVETLPEDSGFAAALRTGSRHELGGDLCELIPIGQGRTIVAIGDASGDSIPAAIIMTAVRGALRAVTAGVKEDMLCPEIVLDRVNQALYGITPPHQFMSFVYGIVDATNRTFTYSNAGHPGPLFLHDGEMKSLPSHGIILGVTATAEYTHSTLNLAAGDTLILFSDGISEAMSRDHRMFGYEGIIDAVHEQINGSAHEILQAIWKRYEAHIVGASEPDDRTLMVLHMTPCTDNGAVALAGAGFTCGTCEN